MSSFVTTLYPSVDLIDSVVFKDINADENIYFSKPFLKAFETRKSANRIQIYYNL